MGWNVVSPHVLLFIEEGVQKHPTSSGSGYRNIHLFPGVSTTARQSGINFSIMGTMVVFIYSLVSGKSG